MLPLSSGEIAQMRDTLEVSLPGTAIIHSATGSADGQGGFTQAFAASGTAIGRLSPVSGTEQTALEKVTVVASHVLTLPAATVVTETDRVVFAGTTYEVTLVGSRATWELGRRVYLSRLG